MLRKFSLYSGMIIPIWLFIGVTIAGAMNPDYSHMNQAMSELGAKGAETYLLSPILNNYPLGILFISFGLYIVATFKESKLAVFSGVMVLIHGLGSILAGVYSCDAGCLPEIPTTSQVIHDVSGLVMFLSLTIAGWLWVFLGKKQLDSKSFSWFSLICMIIALGAAFMLPSAIETGLNFGLYQRINYGVSVVWLAGLSYVLQQFQPRT